MERILRSFKKLKKAALMLLAFVLMALGTKNAKAATLLEDFLPAKGIEVGVSATLDFYSKYVWRGMLLDDDMVLQPGVSLSGYGFEGGFWGSWDLQSDDSLASDEVDGYIGYSKDLGFINEDLSIVTLSVGHTWYDFPEADLYAREYSIGISVDTFLSPTFTYYHDYSEEASGGANGSYYILGVSHSFTLNEAYGISLDLADEVGFNNNYFITGNGGYNLTTVGVTLPLTENMTISPSIGYSVPFGDLADDDGGNPQKEQFYGGVSLAFSF